MIQRHELQFKKYMKEVLTTQEKGNSKKSELPLPYEESKKDYPQPSVLDIQRFIKSYLPLGLHGVDKDGNLLDKSDKSSESEDELNLIDNGQDD